MKREQLGKTVDKLVPSLALNERNRTSAIHLLTLHLLISERKIPSQCSSFSRSEILHGMETERRKISNLTSHLAMTRSTERMSAVIGNGDAAQKSLNIICRTELRQNLQSQKSNQHLHFVNVTNPKLLVNAEDFNSILTQPLKKKHSCYNPTIIQVNVNAVVPRTPRPPLLPQRSQILLMQMIILHLKQHIRHREQHQCHCRPPTSKILVNENIRTHSLPTPKSPLLQIPHPTSPLTNTPSSPPQKSPHTSKPHCPPRYAASPSINSADLGCG